MAISEDLRSIQVVLGTLPGVPREGDSMLRLICTNLQALAEQVESLENLPLHTRELRSPKTTRSQRVHC